MEIEKLADKYQTEILDIPLNQLILVEDPSHPLWDRRVKEPRNADLAEKLRVQGQLQNIVVVPGPEEGTYLVAAGRRRTKAAEGVLDSLVAKVYHIPPTDYLGMAELKISENADREQVAPIDVAFEIRDYLELLRDGETGKLPHGSAKRVMEVFNIGSRQLYADYIKLTGCSSTLVQAIRGEKISSTKAIDIVKATENKDGTPNHEKQDKKLNDLLEKAAAAGSDRVTSGSTGTKEGGKQGDGVESIPGFRPLSKSELNFLIEAPDTGKAYRPLLKFLAGKVETKEERAEIVEKYSFLYLVEPEAVAEREEEERKAKEEERKAKEKEKIEAEKKRAEEKARREKEQAAKKAQKEKEAAQKKKEQEKIEAAKKKEREAREKRMAEAKKLEEKAKELKAAAKPTPKGKGEATAA